MIYFSFSFDMRFFLQSRVFLIFLCDVLVRTEVTSWSADPIAGVAGLPWQPNFTDAASTLFFHCLVYFLAPVNANGRALSLRQSSESFANKQIYVFFFYTYEISIGNFLFASARVFGWFLSKYIRKFMCTM